MTSIANFDDELGLESLTVDWLSIEMTSNGKTSKEQDDDDATLQDISQIPSGVSEKEYNSRQLHEENDELLGFSYTNEPYHDDNFGGHLSVSPFVSSFEFTSYEKPLLPIMETQEMYMQNDIMGSIDSSTSMSSFGMDYESSKRSSMSSIGQNSNFDSGAAKELKEMNKGKGKGKGKAINKANSKAANKTRHVRNSNSMSSIFHLPKHDAEKAEKTINPKQLREEPSARKFKRRNTYSGIDKYDSSMSSMEDKIDFRMSGEAINAIAQWLSEEEQTQKKYTDQTTTATLSTATNGSSNDKKQAKRRKRTKSDSSMVAFKNELLQNIGSSVSVPSSADSTTPASFKSSAWPSTPASTSASSSSMASPPASASVSVSHPAPVVSNSGKSTGYTHTSTHSSSSTSVASDNVVTSFPKLVIATNGTASSTSVSTPTESLNTPLSANSDKPFQCSDCTKSFRRQEHLKRHYRSVHSNERPFECTYCDKKFSRSDNLAQHLRTHKK